MSSEVVDCPHCGFRVAVAEGGECPSCRRTLHGIPSDRAPLVLTSFPRTPVAAANGMTTTEKVYSAVVFACSGLLVLCLAMVHFVLIPGMERPGSCTSWRRRCG